MTPDFASINLSKVYGERHTSKINRDYKVNLEAPPGIEPG